MIAAKTLAKLVKRSQSLLHMPDSRFKHFSYLLRKNTVVAVGYNQGYKTHRIAKQYGCRFDAIHSELHAICKVDCRISELKELTLVNIRLLRSGELRIAKPCQSCSKLLLTFGLVNVFYSTNEGVFKKWSSH